jgi:hypothetical protein
LFDGLAADRGATIQVAGAALPYEYRASACGGYLAPELRY